MTDAWQVFFTAQIGASAALLGLLFVGVSLNLAKILSQALLPNRALLALLLLLAVLVAASLALIPGQPDSLLAAELLLIGAVINAAGFSVSLASCRKPTAQRATVAINIVATALSTLPYPVAAFLLFVGAAGAFHWLAAGMIVSTIKAVADAWVLLVEINR